MSTTGDRIRQAREDRFYGQAELARKAGISKNMLWAVENGRRNPALSTIRKIAEALGVDPHKLVGDEQ